MDLCVKQKDTILKLINIGHFDRAFSGLEFCLMTWPEDYAYKGVELSLRLSESLDDLIDRARVRYKLLERFREIDLNYRNALFQSFRVPDTRD